MDEYVRAIEIDTKDYNSYYKISVILQELNNNEAAINMLNDLLRKETRLFRSNNVIRRHSI